MCSAGDFPLVSCVMPTARRREFVPQAIRLFQLQTYPHRELVIVDDGADAVEDLVPDDPRIRYVRLAGSRSLGRKRNACVEAASGDLIMHWDDDDWMAPRRIQGQVAALLDAGAEVCGVRAMLFHDPRERRTWLYRYPADAHPWLAGGSLLYTRDFWRRSPFPDQQVGSDTSFIWAQRLDRAACLEDLTLYVAMLHGGNTSPKSRSGPYWSEWDGDLRAIMGDDLDHYHGSVRSTPAPREASAYDILMVTHNTLPVTRLAVLRTLRHSAGHDARLTVVDNASSDGTAEWLEVMAQRGDLTLIRGDANPGHGPALEQARARTHAPCIVTLDSDAFPLRDDWLPRLRERLSGKVKVAGIGHHREYIHPSCLMIARQTLDEWGLTFLNEKDRPSRLDVGERISAEVKRRGYGIAPLQRTCEQRRGSASEPVYLGSEYEGLVYHQWYTTRAATAGSAPVDDVAREAIETSLRELLEADQAAPRRVNVIVGVRARPGEPERLRNLVACLRALNFQDLPRWEYHILVIEQDDGPRLERAVAPLADRYVFVKNAGAYNRGWGFNVGARLVGTEGVLCLMDADLLPEPGLLREGLAAFAGGARAVQPYSTVLYLGPGATEGVIRKQREHPGESPPEQLEGQLFTTSQGGCTWVDAGLYHELGGHDERFRGWGREDREFWERLSRAAEIRQLPLRMLHLHHPPADAAQASGNTRLYEEIHAGRASRRDGAFGDPDRYAVPPHPAAECPAPAPRPWQNWARWPDDRIERVVRNEQNTAARQSARRKLADLAARLGETLLDVGCGPGAMWPGLEPHRSRVSWAGVDVTPGMIRTAARLFPQVPVAAGDTGDLPFRDRSFDVVLLRHVLEHLPEWLMRRALREAMRVARRFVLVDLHLPAADGPRETEWVGNGAFLNVRWSVGDLLGPIGEAGWRLVRRTALRGTPGEADDAWIIAHPDEAAARASDRTAPVPWEPLKVSVIMPTYRRPHTLGRAVESLRAQSYGHWELILVDNAGDAELPAADPRIGAFVHAERPSSSYARNRGLEHATGDLVCFFDDDDEMLPEYLERMVSAFEQDREVRMARCRMRVHEGRDVSALATPLCWVRREDATRDWPSDGSAQDRRYFSRLLARHGWSEATGQVAALDEVLCRAHTDPQGGLRSGGY